MLKARRWTSFKLAHPPVSVPSALTSMRLPRRPLSQRRPSFLRRLSFPRRRSFPHRPLFPRHPSSPPVPSHTAAAAGILVAPTVNRKGKVSTPTLRYPSREVRMGPAVWGRDISAQVLIIIRAVLGTEYDWDKVSVRAHRAETDNRDKDQAWVYLEFVPEGYATWFIDAFTAARASPYDMLTVSRYITPN
ncbi:hypothetical protein B0H16DRAFT_116371 [Mycena metata]|uniref:Uncharacterized protein n=1 Tax=Mycena metata TaxID=1033252 RepID=A0AAD7JXR1_9AGAR|nr:hypothetical protein B0H16DRAFT_116371 [Mycena metata]